MKSTIQSFQTRILSRLVQIDGLYRKLRYRWEAPGGLCRHM
jgi:hypothetical protein